MNREQDLYPPIKALLERQGYIVKGEVGAADIVAMREDEPPVIVELKLRFTLSLFHQAIARLKLTDQVYIGVSKPTGRTARRALRDNLALCRRLGLGLITVRADGTVEVLVDKRDATGKVSPRPVRIRNVGVGSLVTISFGAITVDSVDGRTVTDTDGNVIELGPGEDLYEVGGDEPVVPEQGDLVSRELRDVRIAELDRGEIMLIEDGERQTLEPRGSTIIMQVRRATPLVEIEMHEAVIGDTLRIGPNTVFRDHRDSAAQFNAVIATMAWGMALLSLTLVNGRLLRDRKKDWYNGAVFFLAVGLGVIVGVYKYWPVGTPQQAFSDTIIMQVITALGSAIFSLLSFYLATASYRAFRVKTAEAGLMMAAALIIMLGQTPFGMYLSGWMGDKFSALWLPNVAGWILRVPNTGLFRALIFGVMMGAMATAIRYWLSLEKSQAMGGDE